MDYQVLYSFALYVLWIALPLIPAMLIYWAFPGTQVGAKGLLGNLKINATGAFAAYLIVSVLGFFIIRHIQGIITSSSYQTWEVTAKLKYVDKNNVLFADQDKLVKLTNIRIQPFITNQSADFVQFLVTGQGRRIVVNFSNSQDFDSRAFDLQKSDIAVDEPNRRIDLGTVTIHEIPHYYSVTEGKKDTVGGPPISNPQ